MQNSRRWTATDIPDLTGKTAVVTGGNSGIGFETVAALAQHGANTIMASRSKARGQEAMNRIDSIVPSGSVRLMILDLGDLSSISRFVEDFRQQHDELQILVNNAGIMATPYRTTVDGFESQFGTNHLGHFALTARLMPMLLNAESARVVNVSSLAHRRGRFDFKQLQFEREGYSRWQAYGNSKLANLLFTYELQRRLERSSVKHVASLASHPGFTSTNLGAGMGFLGQILMIASRWMFQTADMGALPTLRAATDPNAKGGEYYGPDRPNERRGYPVIVSSSTESHDEESARWLWENSEELTGVKFEF